MSSPSNTDSSSAHPSSAPLQMNPEALAPWRTALSRAIHRNRSVPFSRYLQLATLRPNGTPANRTVVFRGFWAETNQLMFISDRRSQKAEDIAHNPNTEACWYFTKTREQFRLSGQITLITADTEQSTLRQARQQSWQNISANARIPFAWPQAKAPRANAAAFNPPTPNDQTPPPSFCLLLLAVHTVDHLELRGEPQNRAIYSKVDDSKREPFSNAQSESNQSEPQWGMTSVNP